MNEEQEVRYSRHILLKDLGYEGQDKIANSHVLVIGAGGLGSPASMYLASGGFGKLTLVDNDQVELTNLQRQILHSTDRIGKNKAESGKQTLTGINPTIDIVTITDRMDETSLPELVRTADVVLDCTDNFKTRLIVNRACMAAGRSTCIRVPSSSSTGKSRFTIHGVMIPPVTPACFRKTSISRI